MRNEIAANTLISTSTAKDPTKDKIALHKIHQKLSSGKARFE